MTVEKFGGALHGQRGLVLVVRAAQSQQLAHPINDLSALPGGRRPWVVPGQRFSEIGPGALVHCFQPEPVAGLPDTLTRGQA